MSVANDSACSSPSPDLYLSLQGPQSTVLSSWVFVEKKRSLIEVFPAPVQNLWNKWELRVMVLISLALQISLIHFGNRRKYNARSWIGRFLWCAYLMADWSATVALGVLSYKQRNTCSCGGKNDKDNPLEDELRAFWAPFLLLHLGGPDTITAYALADNELWARHLLGLVVQTGVALYVTLMAWKGSLLSFLTIPMLLAGLIKYGERSWVLRSANRGQFRDSMLTPPDPGPNYAKFMEEFSLKEAEGFCVNARKVKEVMVPVEDSSVDDKMILLKAQSFFNTFKRLFVGLILSYRDRDESQSYFWRLDSKTAFNVIEIELGFAYDVFYTKVPIIYTSWGIIFRLITSFSTLLVFVLFLMDEKHRQLQMDLIVTYILLVGAILLEMYALISLLSSDWTNLWLAKKNPQILSRIISHFQISPKQKWSHWVGQHNFLSFCLKDEHVVWSQIRKRFPSLYHTLETRWYKTHNPISEDLKDMIFKHFQKKSKGEKKSEKKIKSLCNHRGSVVLKEYKCPKIHWTTTVEFDQSVLIWHIATALCYYSDSGENHDATINSHREQSKCISDYMLYLSVMCPFMLPSGIGMIRFRDTCAEAVEFFREKGSTPDRVSACQKLLQVSTKVSPASVKGDRSKSVLFDACSLASFLQENMEINKKWEMVREVWVEILGYAACHCEGYYHAQQLVQGGELLTHVWLLMAHLGIAEQFQISEGHARAKLTVK